MLSTACQLVELCIVCSPDHVVVENTVSIVARMRTWEYNSFICSLVIPNAVTVQHPERFVLARYMYDLSVGRLTCAVCLRERPDRTVFDLFSPCHALQIPKANIQRCNGNSDCTGHALSNTKESPL